MNSIQKLFVILGLSIIVLLVVIVLPLNSNVNNYQVNSVAAKPERTGFRTESNANLFRIVDTQVNGSIVRLTFKNEYNKSINAFHILKGSDGGAFVELAYSDTQTEIVPNENFIFSTQLTESVLTKGITVAAVIFTDGSGDGIEESLQEMKDKRSGERLQLLQAIKWLKELEFTHKNGYEKFGKLSAKVSSMSEDNVEVPADVRRGLHTGREALQNYLNPIETNKNSLTTDQLVVQMKSLQLKLEQIVLRLK